MKNKIISIFLSCFLVFNTSVTSFASSRSVISTGVISYELLMGLMALGTAFGLALPNNDEEYWDYTNSLKKHLNVVDDKYLELLEKSSINWNPNNNDNNDDEGSDSSPLKIPLIDGFFDTFKKLFDNVGNEVSSSYTYKHYLLDPLVVSNGSLNFSKLNFVYVPYGDSFKFDYPGGLVTFKNNDYGVWMNIYNSDGKGANVNTCRKDSQGGTYIAPFYNSASNTYSYVSWDGSGSFLDDNYCRYTSLPSNLFEWYNDSSSPTYTKPSISYSPVDPSVENEEIIVPGGLPSVSIPSIETVPGYDEGLNIKPPFEVSPPLTDGDIGTDGDTGSDGDTGVDGDVGLGQNIINSIINLVVPSSDYWQNTFNNFFDNIGNAFPVIDVGRFKDLCINGVAPKDINVTIMGSTGTIFNTKYLNSIVDWLQPIVSAFMAFLLMLYNYRKVYKLIRGFEPFGGIADGNSVGEVRGKMDGAMPQMGESSFVGPSTSSTWSDGQSVTRGSIQSRYYGRDL